MTQEEVQILLIDLCARLPYGVKCRIDYDNEEDAYLGVERYADDEIVSVCIETEEIGLYDASEYFYPNEIKPYLRPLSSMTEEEFKMVCSMNALTDTELRDRINFPNMFVKSYTIETFDLFNSHHFDYRGLIPMGLALEAKEDMYKTE